MWTEKAEKRAEEAEKRAKEAEKRAKEAEHKLAQTEAVRVPPTHTHLAWRACVCHLPPATYLPLRDLAAQTRSPPLDQPVHRSFSLTSTRTLLHLTRGDACAGTCNLREPLGDS